MKDSSNSKYKYLKYKLKYNNFFKKKKLKGGFLIESLLVISILLMSFGTTYILYNSTSKSSRPSTAAKTEKATSSAIAAADAKPAEEAKAAATPTTTKSLPAAKSLPVANTKLAKEVTIELSQNVEKKILPNLLENQGIQMIESIITVNTPKAIKEFEEEMKKAPEKYLQNLTTIISRYTKNDSIQNLQIAKIPGDGWCQFRSIIHQLLQQDKKDKLRQLKNKYDDSNYRPLIENKELRKKISNFIEKLIINSENMPNDDFVEDLLTIMTTFVTKHGNIILYECPAPGESGVHDNYESLSHKIWTDFRTELELDNFTEDVRAKLNNFDDSVVRNIFSNYYHKNTKNWGRQITLIIIQFIFNLEITLYTLHNNKILTTRNKLTTMGYMYECIENESFIQISLVYKPYYHYDSVIETI